MRENEGTSEVTRVESEGGGVAAPPPPTRFGYRRAWMIGSDQSESCVGDPWYNRFPCSGVRTERTHSVQV